MVFMFKVHSIYQVLFEPFICVTPFNLQNNPMRQVLSIFIDQGLGK